MSMTSVRLDEASETYLEQAQRVKKQSRIKNFVKGMLFLSPSILLFGLFVFYPLFKTIYLSFFHTDAKGHATVFVGWENYQSLFTDPIFLKSIKNTFLFILYTVLPTVETALETFYNCGDVDEAYDTAVTQFNEAIERANKARGE